MNMGIEGEERRILGGRERKNRRREKRNGEEEYNWEEKWKGL